MPKPTMFHPLAVTGLLERVAAALTEERKSIAAYLEKQHAALLSELKGKFGPSTHFPDDGPEVLPQEPLSSTKVEQQTSDIVTVVQGVPQGLQTSSLREGGSISSGIVAPQAGESLHVRSTDVNASHSVFPQTQAKVEAKSQRQDSAVRWSDSEIQVNETCSRPVSHRQDDSFCKTRSITHSRTKKATIMVAGETMNREAVVRRVRAKLGYHAMGEHLSARYLHMCLESLTLETFDENQVHQLVSVLQSRVAPKKKPDAKLGRSLSLQSLKIIPNQEGVEFRVIVDVLCMNDLELQEKFDEYSQEQITILRDILLATDANSMVAELLNLRIDDIAVPTPGATALDYLEPVIGAVILLNGVTVGLQTVPEIAEHVSMLVADVCITFLFIVEFFVKLRYTGFSKHFFGPECHWNWFDLSIILLALIDVVLNIAAVEFDTSAMTVVRLARLTRLARLARIFRVSWLSELSLVCKGLIGGLRTLFWAVVLLFLIIYVVSVFLTLTIGQEVAEAEDLNGFQEVLDRHFSTLPHAAFTTFRCLLTLDCTTDTGRPILVMATEKYGWVVPLFYIFLFVTVSIGLMNLIMGIYLESTLREAKNDHESNKEVRRKQSLRVAMQLKRLLLKISALQAGHHRSMRDSEVAALMDVDHMTGLAKRTVDPNLEITKDVFMMAVQDPEIQHLMNDLGIPPERAHLFDAIDAGGRGELTPRELLNGLLKVRGEPRKSDTAAVLLAVRHLQTQIDMLDTQTGDRHNELLEFLMMSPNGARNDKSGLGMK